MINLNLLIIIAIIILIALSILQNKQKTKILKAEKINLTQKQIQSLNKIYSNEEWEIEKIIKQRFFSLILLLIILFNIFINLVIYVNVSHKILAIIIFIVSTSFILVINYYIIKNKKVIICNKGIIYQNFQKKEYIYYKTITGFLTNVDVWSTLIGTSGQILTLKYIKFNKEKKEYQQSIVTIKMYDKVYKTIIEHTNNYLNKNID